ncbi:TIGR02611 family protein [Kineococcus aurantiacus]|uniref:Uncharacterized protein (TIGR02611 family) n=1 Tax=Kineococcus aurantiacus TaxID=37633 RepID=A0A7Y9ASD8_9ACTN|nr:uncharacterized protein (TIGR02611 family) [Kineococcus aurantiacus]
MQHTRDERPPAVPDPPPSPRPVPGQVAAGPAPSAHQHRVRRLRVRLHAWRERVRADPHRNRVYRAVVGAVGSFVVVLGLALVPLPGPGWLVVFGGLAVLATEFATAARLKRWGERAVHRWGRWLAARSLVTRAALAGGTAAVATGALWGYLAWQGLPGWTPQVVTAQLQWLPGL